MNKYQASKLYATKQASAGLWGAGIGAGIGGLVGGTRRARNFRERLLRTLAGAGIGGGIGGGLGLASKSLQAPRLSGRLWRPGELDNMTQSDDLNATH